MNFKSKMRMEIKEISETGTFEGILSPYGNVDGGGDVVEPGAYTRTLKAHGYQVPMLWQHRSDTPIGKLSLEDSKEGLLCKGQLLMDLPDAQKAYLLIKNKIVKGLSIGFETIKDSIENGIRHLKEIRLYEGSIVTFPMNEMAMITGVKARGVKGDFNEELSEYQTLDAYYQMLAALSNAMSSCVWSDIPKDEKISMCGTILQQFSDAFAGFFPDYLAALASVYGIDADEEWSSNQALEIKAVKSGARHSAETKSVLTSASEKIKGGYDDIQALLGDGLDDTEQKGAVTPDPEPANPKSDPGVTHSAKAEALIAEIMASI